MGIINLTPDSFYEKSRHRKIKDILKKTDKMLTDGADFIDIGGYSSRPGADDVAEEEEITRVVPIVEKLTRHFPSALVSVDTFRSEVARHSLDSGAAIINDISAGHLDNQMMTVVKKYQVPYIIMHMKGTPQNMKTLNQYDDLITDIKYYFSERIAKANQLGINDLIIDPGLGFAKNIDQNFKLLKHLSDFEDFNYPMLIGLSRKSMIYKTLGFTADQALNGTSALNMLALDRGASILRVHDVKEAIECCRLFNKMN